MAKVGTEATLLNILGVTTAIARKTAISTMANFKEMINDGTASFIFPVGTQFGLKFKRTAAATAIDLPFDIVHYDSDGAYLKSHYAGPEAIQFDAPEAIYYAGNGGLAAGTYHIDIGSAYGNGWDTSKSIQFTLANALEEDDQIYIECGTDNKTDPTNGRTLTVYAKGSTTAKETTTTSNGTGGTSLGTIGATSAQKPEGQLNAISRVVYGSGRWSQSAIRQYLNSAAAAGSWWTAQNGWDRPPAQHSTVYGFMAGMDQELLDVIDTVDVVTALNTVEGYQDTYETTQDKFFLPSLQEMYINPQLANTEGVDWDYYKQLASEAGLSGKFQQGQTYPILIGYDAASPTSPVHVRLRSAGRGYAYAAWYVNSSGYVYANNAYNALRGWAACKIKKKS